MAAEAKIEASNDRRIAGVVRWLRDRAKEHDREASMHGGAGWHLGQEAATRASECRRVADEIEGFWT